MIVKEVLEKSEKQKITRNILEALPDWFGVEESREEYIRDSIETPMVAAYEGDKAVGFICLKETGNATVEIHVMGVLKDYHRKGIGKELFKLACKKAKEIGAKKLYISAHSSKESQAAYRRLGCIEATEINRVLAEKEPYDIQMEYVL